MVEPDASKTRTWTDRSGSFKVEAEFIGLKDGKIHLHKLNGVKIAVPVPKMSIEDLEYVERVTGVSLDEDKPLSEIKRRNTQRTKDRNREPSTPTPSGPKADTRVPKGPEYDWFDFFLQCGVNPQICERYAQAFKRDQMGEENMPDISPQLLRTLGLKEGDILRVMRFLDNRFGRTPTTEKRGVSFGGVSVMENGDAEAAEGADGAAGGLFSGPGGTLRNNTRKGRPAPPIQTNDVVDPKAFEQRTGSTGRRPQDATPTPLTSAPAPQRATSSGFDDNAWEPRESKASQQPTRPAVSSSPAPAPTPTSAAAPSVSATADSLAGLDLLTPPLVPTQAPQQAPAPPTSAPPQQSQPTGVTPSLWDQLARQQPQSTGIGQQQLTPQQFASPRQRPQPPQQMQTTGSLIAPPPPRAASAPQNFQQQSAFGLPPLQPQYTGSIHSQPAPPGQSLQELNQQRLQQPFGQPMQQQQTGFNQPNGAFSPFQNGLMSQPTGFPPFPQQQPGYGVFQPPLQQQQTGFPPSVQQQFLAGQQTGSPFADPPRPPFQPLMSQSTGMPSTFSPTPSLNPQATGINAFLPPALVPQRTGAIPQFGGPQGGFGQAGFGQAVPPVPPIPQQQQTMAPLVPQKTGPPPPVRFGVGGAARLVPQATGRRANLSQASKCRLFLCTDMGGEADWWCSSAESVWVLRGFVVGFCIVWWVCT